MGLPVVKIHPAIAHLFDADNTIFNSKSQQKS